MLNEAYILKQIEAHLGKKRTLSEVTFFALFGSLTRKEHYEIINMLIKHDITYLTASELSAQADDEALSNAPAKPTGVPAVNPDTAYTQLLPLTNEQLAVMAQQGDRGAAAALIEKNKSFIYQIVWQQQKQHPNISMTEDDLFQEGCIGVLKAIDKFDISMGYYFLTYCAHWIRQTISCNIVNHGYMIRIPLHMYEKAIKINYYRKTYPLLNHAELVDLIMNAQEGPFIASSREEIERCLSLASHYLNTASLNALFGEDKKTPWLDLVPDDEELSVEAVVESRELARVMNRVLQTLTAREEEILRARFGIDTGIPVTLEALGERYRVTRERIRQIEAKALRKLRHPSRSKHLRGFGV